MNESERVMRSQIEKGKISKEERDRETGKPKKRWRTAGPVNEKKRAKIQEGIACRINRMTNTDKTPPGDTEATAKG